MRRFALVLLLAGCGSPTEPSHPTLQFENGVVFGIPTLPTTAVGGTGSILITGVIQTSTSGFSLFGDLQGGNGGTLTLQIDVYQTGPGLNFLTQNYYRANVRSLAPGDYELSVIHVLHDPGPLRRVLAYRETVRVN